MVCNWECAIHSWQLSSVSNNLSFHYTVFSWGFWSWIMILPDMHSSIVPNNHLVEFLIIYLSWWLILLKTISYELVAEIPLILRVYWMLNHWNPKCWRVQSSFFHVYVHQIPARKKNTKETSETTGFSWNHTRWGNSKKFCWLHHSSQLCWYLPSTLRVVSVNISIVIPT